MLLSAHLMSKGIEATRLTGGAASEIEAP